MTKSYDKSGLSSDVELGKDGNRLYSDSDGIAALTNSGVITNFRTGVPSLDDHAVPKNYVDFRVDNVVSGEFWEPAVAASDSSTILIGVGSSPTIGGKLLFNGDRVVLTAQSNAVENGVYVFDGVNSLIRSDDADESSDFTSNKTIYVSDGTNAGSTFSYSGAPYPVIDSSLISFTKKSSGDIPLDYISTDYIQDAAVTSSKIANEAVDTYHLSQSLSNTIESTLKRIKTVVTYDGGVKQLVGQVPNNAIVMRVFAKVVSVFDPGSTLSIGDDNDNEVHMQASDVNLEISDVYTNDDVNMASSISIYAYIDPTTSTGGSVEIYVEYLE